MEKISGIVPASARTKSVDVSRSQPVRPGAPRMGRPEGRVTKNIEDKVTLSSVAAERSMPEYPINYKQKVETARAKVVSDLADKFFNAPKVIAREGDMTQSEQIAENINNAETTVPATVNVDSEPLRGSVIREMTEEN